MANTVLKIENLQASVEGTPILKGLDLEIGKGEVHAIMGPNGSGKSTFSKVVAGHPDYEVDGGSVHYLGQDIGELSPDERAAQGIFMAFQYPVEIPGVNNMYFLKAALNAQRKARGEEELDAVGFLERLTECRERLGISKAFLDRGVNQGFSGGEKKRNEVLQMSLLEPKLALMDETDSGLDIDALRIVAEGVNALRDGERSFVVITHYQRLLDYIVPDYVHVLSDGKIIRSGDKSLALELEEQGYGWITSAGAEASAPQEARP